jgi:hypothetical protein
LIGTARVADLPGSAAVVVPVVLILLLPLLVGLVPPDEATCRGADDAMVARIVTGHAADQRALEAPLALGAGTEHWSKRLSADSERRSYYGFWSRFVPIPIIILLAIFWHH